MPRVVGAETLDHLAAQHPAARRSRRDLVRVHRMMGTRGILASGWRTLLGERRDTAPLRILEIGAGDGTLLLGVARRLAPTWPQVELTLLDRLDIVGAATLAGYAQLGWTVRVEVADALDWAAGCAAVGAQTRAPVPAPTWDLVSCALFLHHFEGAQLLGLLAGIASCTDRFFACEPQRSWRALLGSHLVGAIGANAVTRGDAVLSVHAGFRDGEITAHWPSDGSAWQCAEFPARLFSHCFSARRSRAN